MYCLFKANKVSSSVLPFPSYGGVFSRCSCLAHRLSIFQWRPKKAGKRRLEPQAVEKGRVMR
uniref:Uncharacterized protein n=1 Tax=Arundo donax TaxID=35708 RepID=A0A0A8ZU80_ARUDO